jgi:hypothetical protein
MRYLGGMCEAEADGDGEDEMREKRRSARTRRDEKVNGWWCAAA